MKEEFLMTTQKRRQHFILASILFIVALYTASVYVSNPQPYTGGYQISPQLDVMFSTNQTYSDGDTLNTYSNNLKESLEDINSVQNPNVSIKIVTTQKTDKVFKVEYPDHTQNTFNNSNLFIEMKDISRTVSNIFFIETRCSTKNGAKDYVDNKGFVLNARQCCAIESTALTNLDRMVYIFHSCPLSSDFLTYSPKFVEKMFRYPNVRVVRLTNAEAFKDTPVQQLQEKDLMETSQHPIEHTSDVLRLVLLWKFGGTYCDLDVVTIRSLNALKNNWAGMQDPDTIANGVLNFEPDGVGHQLLQFALEHINKHFDGASWSSNGPLLVTPLILKLCKVNSVPEANKQCHGRFTVFDAGILYPLYYPSYGELFDENIGQRIVQQVKKSSYSVHIWNKMSHDSVIQVGSTQAYGLLADEFCPEVYHNCGSTF